MKKLPFLFALLFAPALAGAQADVYIGVTGTQVMADKIPVGFPAFVPDREGRTQDMEMGVKMQDIIRADLLFSRYFSAVEGGPAVDPKKPKSSLQEWKMRGARYVLYGKTAQVGNLWTLSASVFDTESGDKIIEKYYKGELPAARRAAHLYSDEVTIRITGKLGIAHTRLAFANDSTGKKEIYVVDYDGLGLQRLTDDRSIALLPRWSHDGSKVYYTTYRYKNPDLFEIDLKGRKIKPASTTQGLNIAGGISPDGQHIVMTMSRGGTPHIYMMDLVTKQLTQLTSGQSVDSSPTFSPDGKYVSYTSDRSGTPQLYIMELETGQTRRVTRLNWCDSPKWSPSGEWIVFAGRQSPREEMDIWLIDITGNQLRQLTKNAGKNENPSWSPDGRFIAFTSTRNNKREIYVMDADGSAPHTITSLPGKCFTPNWSP